MNYELRIKNFVILLLVAGYLLLVATPAQAQTMSNDDYIIKMQGFNTLSGVSTSDDYELRSTAGGQSSTSSEGVNFTVKTGFENLAATLPFSVSLSSDSVDFGILSPTNPIIRTLSLTMNSLAAYGYSVLISENKPLTTIPPAESSSAAASESFIPDTTCDNGKCDAQAAAEWINTLTYGFGYRCDNETGADCESSFGKISFYKHFPDIANNDDLISIMAGIGANNRKARISYKVNISGNQAQRTYNNTVTYLAVPNF